MAIAIHRKILLLLLKMINITIQYISTSFFLFHASQRLFACKCLLVYIDTIVALTLNILLTIITSYFPTFGFGSGGTPSGDGFTFTFALFTPTPFPFPFPLPLPEV